MTLSCYCAISFKCSKMIVKNEIEMHKKRHLNQTKNIKVIALFFTLRIYHDCFFCFVEMTSSLQHCINKATAFIQDDTLYVSCISRDTEKIAIHCCKSFAIDVSINVS